MPKTVNTLKTLPKDDASSKRLVQKIIPLCFAATPVKNLRIYSIMIAIHHVVSNGVALFLNIRVNRIAMKL